jgi:hypothetical protein
VVTHSTLSPATVISFQSLHGYDAFVGQLIALPGMPFQPWLFAL